MTKLLQYTVGCVLFALCSVADPIDVEVVVETDHVVQDIDEDFFVGVTMDCFIMQDNWEGFDFSNRRMLNLARGIAPSFLRIGGTACDSLTFKRSEAEIQPHTVQLKRPPFTTNFTMTDRDWDGWNTFVQNVGWKMIFGINAKKRSGAKWDPTNALSLVQYTAEKGYPIYGFELSNEPNLFPRSVPPEQLGVDFTVLQKILQTRSQFAKTLIIGPDTGNVGTYFDQFLKSDGGRVVNVATYHTYYIDGRHAVLSQFVDPKILDTLITNIMTALGMGKSSIPGKPVWLGETSSAYNTGAPGISDTFVAGFM